MPYPFSASSRVALPTFLPPPPWLLLLACRDSDANTLCEIQGHTAPRFAPPSRSKRALAVADKIARPLPSRVPASSHPSPRSPCPSNKSVANWGGNQLQ